MAEIPGNLKSIIRILKIPQFAQYRCHGWMFVQRPADKRLISCKNTFGPAVSVYMASKSLLFILILKENQTIVTLRRECVQKSEKIVLVLKYHITFPSSGAPFSYHKLSPNSIRDKNFNVVFSAHQILKSIYKKVLHFCLLNIQIV